MALAEFASGRWSHNLLNRDKGLRTKNDKERRTKDEGRTKDKDQEPRLKNQERRPREGG